MKKLFTTYLKNELAAKELILSGNAINDEDKALLETQIENLKTLINQVDEMEETADTKTIVDELKETVTGMDSQITAIAEKIASINKNTEEDTEMTKNEYLNSKNAVKDFANAIRNSKKAEEFRANWNEALVTNGIEIEEGSEDAYLPVTVQGMINDIWDRNADWLKDLHVTGAKRFNVRHNTSDQNAETSRAKGWKGGKKEGQTINLSAKLLEAQFIYKIIEIDLKTKFDNDEALINYVVTELTDQVLYEIKRAILVGDGRQSNDPYKIDKIEAIVSADSTYTTTITLGEGEYLIDGMVNMVNAIKNDSNKPVYAFMSKARLTELRRIQASDSSTPMYLPIEQVRDTMGVARIITTDLLPEGTDAVAFIPSEYYMVGESILNPVLYTWHEGWTNSDVYRAENVVGGGLNGMKSAAVLVQA